MLVLAHGAAADEPVVLREPASVGTTCHVRGRAEMAGSLRPPAESGKAAPAALKIQGDSTIEYDERILALDAANEVARTLRIYERIELRRTIGDKAQEAHLRPAVRRLVLMREGLRKAPFSPDGPLTWGEIDLVRTDLLTPLLSGLLPDKPVRPGESWEARTAALQELTDVVHVDDAKLIVRLDSIAVRERRHLAQLTFSGEVRGTNEDGPTRHQLRGQIEFDLDGGGLTYLLLNGTQTMQDRENREVGRLEGRFVLSRMRDIRPAGLSDEAVHALKLEPDADNTALLYDNPRRGLSFVYPRRWRVSESRPNQVVIEGPGGLLMLTVEPLPRLPSAGQFLKESREFLQTEKVRIVQVAEPKPLAGPINGEWFRIDAESETRKILRVYYVLRARDQGALLAADLAPTDPDARRDLERLVRSLVLSRQP